MQLISTQLEDLDELIRELAWEQDSCHSIAIPEESDAKRRLIHPIHLFSNCNQVMLGSEDHQTFGKCR